MGMAKHKPHSSISNRMGGEEQLRPGTNGVGLSARVSFLSWPSSMPQAGAQMSNTKKALLSSRASRLGSFGQPAVGGSPGTILGRLTGCEKKIGTACKGRRGGPGLPLWPAAAVLPSHCLEAAVAGCLQTRASASHQSDYK